MNVIRSEDLVISCILRGAGIRTAIRAGATSDLFIHRKAEWKYLEENKGVSKATFKSRFPEFKIVLIEADELDTLIKDLQRNRADMELGQVITKYTKLLGKDVDPIDLSAKMAADLTKVITRFGKTTELRILEDWHRIYADEEIKAAALANGSPRGLPFGLPTLDNELGGMLDQDLMVIMARMGEMKTWVSLKFMTEALLAGAKGIYFSLEMSPMQIAHRVHAIMSNRLAQTYTEQFKTTFSNTGLMFGSIDLKELRRYLMRARKNVQNDLIIPDIGGNFTIASCQAAIENHSPNIVAFDYFGLGVSSESNNKNDQNWVAASGASHKAKALAKEYKIPFILNAQANRGAAGSKDVPQLEHAALTDSIGQDADRVFGLRFRKGELRLHVTKNRHGDSGQKVIFNLDVDNGQFEEMIIPAGHRQMNIEDQEITDE